jgi:hypothetical protein
LQFFGNPTARLKGCAKTSRDPRRVGRAKGGPPGFADSSRWASGRFAAFDPPYDSFTFTLLGKSPSLLKRGLRRLAMGDPDEPFRAGWVRFPA